MALQCHGCAIWARIDPNAAESSCYIHIHPHPTRKRRVLMSSTYITTWRTCRSKFNSIPRITNGTIPGPTITRDGRISIHTYRKTQALDWRFLRWRILTAWPGWIRTFIQNRFMPHDCTMKRSQFMRKKQREEQTRRVSKRRTINTQGPCLQYMQNDPNPPKKAESRNVFNKK